MNCNVAFFLHWNSILIFILSQETFNANRLNFPRRWNTQLSKCYFVVSRRCWDCRSREFSTFLPFFEPLGQFQKSLTPIILVRKSQVFKKQIQQPFPMGDKRKVCLNTITTLKHLFRKTHWVKIWCIVSLNE